MKLLLVVECRWPPTHAKGQAGSQAPCGGPSKMPVVKPPIWKLYLLGCRSSLISHMSTTRTAHPYIFAHKQKPLLSSMSTAFPTWLLTPSSRGLALSMDEDGLEGALWLSEFPSSCAAFPRLLPTLAQAKLSVLCVVCVCPAFSGLLADAHWCPLPFGPG